MVLAFIRETSIFAVCKYFFWPHANLLPQPQNVLLLLSLFLQTPALQTLRHETTGMLQVSRPRSAGRCSLGHAQPGVGLTQWDGSQPFSKPLETRAVRSQAHKPCSPSGGWRRAQPLPAQPPGCGCLGASAEQTCPKYHAQPPKKHLLHLTPATLLLATRWIIWMEWPENRWAWNKWKQILKYFQSSENESLLAHFFPHHRHLSFTFLHFRVRFSVFSKARF